MYFIMPPPLGAGGIMFLGCPSVRPSEAWNTLFWPVHGSVGPPDQPRPFYGMSVRQSTGLDRNYRSRKITARWWLHKYVGAECGASSFTWYLYQMCNIDVRPHMYNWMKWLRLLGGWHFIAATAIKPPKAACQFAADDILLYKFANISNGFTSPFGKKEKKNCHLYNTILSLYISYQDITRRVC